MKIYPIRKIIAIVITGLIIFVLMHMFGPEVSESSGAALGLAPSPIMLSGWFLPAVLILTLIVYSLFCGVFVRIQFNLPYPGWLKGTLYGLAFGGLWWIGMLEASLVLGTPFADEVFTGFADFLPILSMGVLMGLAMGTLPAPRVRKAPVHLIFWIGLCFLFGRYIAYAGLINSAYSVNILGTFTWTATIGLWIGLMYWLLEAGLHPAKPLRRAWIFGVLVFGMNWLLYGLYVPLAFEVNLLDIFVRAAVDIIFVTGGVYLSESWISARAVRPVEVNIPGSAG